MVGVGLLYRQGYFGQRTDASGRQHEYWTDSDPEHLPAALVTGGDGLPLEVEVQIGGAAVVAQVWRVNVGRVPLYLLDSDVEENQTAARWITSRLYISNPDLRLAQCLLLGVGGVRALTEMGIVPGVIHINEGHAAFAALEYARSCLRSDDIGSAAPQVVFTTHTPVRAGNPTYPAEELERVAGAFAQRSGIGIERLLRLGRSRPDEAGEPFGLTQLGLRTSGYANAVSRRHGEVARSMWGHLWPQAPPERVPIGAITNGVHLPTWIGAPMRMLLQRHLPAGWHAAAAEVSLWAAAVQGIPATELWSVRSQQRAKLVDELRRRSVIERLSRGEGLEAASAGAGAFDPDALTIGFGRRLTAYKRLDLLIADIPSLRALLAGEHAIQIVISGKAHPDDETGKHVLGALFDLTRTGELAARVVFLDDYDLATAMLMLQGCDLWMNLPRPPLEASGTSGMKSAINGGLQVSVLDGWWAEAYDGENGWALSGEVDPDTNAQDARHGVELQRLLREEIVPLFYERDEHRIPQGWVTRIRASISSIVPAFSTKRMLAEYTAEAYSRAQRPAHRAREAPGLDAVGHGSG
jgi:starch phosphorylase